MAGVTKRIQRIWATSSAIAANLVIDPLYALFTQVNNLVADVETIRYKIGSRALTSPGMVITGAGTKTAKNGSAFNYIDSVAGVAVYGQVAANTNTAAFAGTVTNAKFNVFVHTVKDDGAGAQTFATRMGVEGAARSNVVFPTVPSGEVIYGITEIHPTGTGNFIGNTTNLDDATVVPNASFISIFGLPAASSAADLVASSLTDLDNA